MADAPSGGGWSGFEIALVIILAIALLSRIRGISPAIRDNPPLRNSPKETVVSKPQPTIYCGLTMTKPRPLQKVTNSVSVAGTISGCGWERNGDVAVYAQVVNEMDMPISDYVTISRDKTDANNVTFFSKTISLYQTDDVNRGYVVIFPATATNSVAYLNPQRIPIVFR